MKNVKYKFKAVYIAREKFNYPLKHYVEENMFSDGQQRKWAQTLCNLNMTLKKNHCGC